MQLSKDIIILILSEFGYENMMKTFLICKKWYIWIKYSDYFYEKMLMSKVQDRLSIPKYILKPNLFNEKLLWKEYFCLKNLYKPKFGTIKYKENIEFLYEGEISDIFADGRGVMYFNNNAYIGDFKKSRFDGKGIYYSGNTIYTGQFKKNKRCGLGQMKYDNGTIYEGMWKNGVMEGKGKYMLEDKIITGKWNNGVLTYGKIEYKKYKTYIGYIKNFVPHGAGTIKYNNGKNIIGNFIDGELDGEVEITYEDITLKGIYKNNILIGQTIIYLPYEYTVSFPSSSSSFSEEEEKEKEKKIEIYQGINFICEIYKLEYPQIPELDILLKKINLIIN